MENLAKHEQNHSMYQEVGTVIQVENETFLVTVGQSQYHAKKAVGCLLFPEPEDEVLLATSASGRCYILSVLERSKPGKNRLHFDGDIEVLSKNGKLQLGSKQGIHFTTPEQIRLASSTLQAVADQGEISISHLSFLGRHFEGTISQIKLIAGKFESFIDFFRQNTKRSYRSVEDIDQLRAGKIDYDAEKLMSIRGKYSIVTAKEDIKIDGKMIHMG